MSKLNSQLMPAENGWSGQINGRSGFSVQRVPNLLQAVFTFDNVLKDDRRSLVKLGVIDGVRVVAKQPRDKNKRKWMRFLSLFFLAESKRTYRTLLEFEAKGLESLTPLAFIEKKRWGMVFDSWLLYEYREGRVSQRSDLPQIIQQLQTLHKHGYRHEDPNFGNFLVDDNGVMFLIDCRGKSRSGLYSDYYDYMLLEGAVGCTRDEIEALVDIDRKSIGYWRAQLYRGYIRGRTMWKSLIGRKRSKSQKH